MERGVTHCISANHADVDIAICRLTVAVHAFPPIAVNPEVMKPGHKAVDVLTVGTILDLFGRQRELNFLAGTEHMYCNSGYTLMAQVVEAVSGVTFPAFCQQRIFGPLAMSRTHAHDDHELIVPGRAYLLRQTFLLILSPFRSTDLCCGAGTRTSRRGRR